MFDSHHSLAWGNGVFLPRLPGQIGSHMNASRCVFDPNPRTFPLNWGFKISGGSKPLLTPLFWNLLLKGKLYIYVCVCSCILIYLFSLWPLAVGGITHLVTLPSEAVAESFADWPSVTTKGIQHVHILGAASAWPWANWFANPGRRSHMDFCPVQQVNGLETLTFGPLMGWFCHQLFGDTSQFMLGMIGNHHHRWTEMSCLHSTTEEIARRFTMLFWDETWSM